MIEAFKPYAEYKESGQVWLGEVPRQWQSFPLCRVAYLVSERGRPDLELLSVYLNRGVIRYSESGGQVHKPSLDRSNYQVVNPGNFVLNNQQAWRGSIGVSKYKGIISPAYVVMSLSNKMNPSYGNYLFRSPGMVAQYVVASRGVGDIQRNLYYPDLKRVQVILPPLDEQAAIVRFLDHANRKVDGFIRAKRKLIALLHEQKQAIIHRAVTRGLNPEVKLKPSGIPWLGDIPAHWEVARIRQKAQIARGRFSHRPRNAPQFYGGRYPFIQTGDIATADKQITSYSQTLNEAGYKISKLFKAGTLAMVITGAKTGHVAILGFDACFPDSAVGFVPEKNAVDKDFLYFAFIALKSELDRASITSTQENLNVQRIGSQVTAWPPLAEQEEIGRHLEFELATLTTAIDRTKREIALMQEYRTRLTADIVTGKLDVRAAATKLPPAEDEPIRAELDDDLLEEADTESEADI